MFDEKKNFIDSNQAGLDLLGYSRDELLSMSIPDVDADPVVVLPTHEQLLSGENIVNYEHQLRRKDGTIITVLNNSRPLTDTEGNVIGMQSTLIDITKRKQVEDAQRESGARLHLATAATQIGHWDWDLRTNEIYFSPEWKRQIGYEDHEIPNRFETWESRLHPDDQQSTVKAVEDYIAGRQAEYEIEFRLRHKDGSYRWIYTRAEKQLDDTGKTCRLFGCHLDITERKKAEEALQISETNLIKAQEVAHIGSWSLDLLENNLVWTDENYRIFGIPKGTPMTYEKFLEVVHPEDRDYVDRKWTAAIEGEPYDIEHRLLIDNEVKWVREKAELIFDDKGNPISGVGITQDITERKQAEDEMHRLREEYTHIARVSAMGELTASLAHELKQPLAAIRSNAQAAQRFLTGSEPDIDELHDVLKDIIKDNRRADDVIVKLRAIMQKTEIQSTQLNINEVVQDVLPLLKSYEIVRNISLELELDKNVPHVIGDKVQLQQVILNLILNSTEALVNTKVKSRTIVIRTIHKHSEVTISVKDNGPGIEEKAMGRLFEPFYTTKKEGLGMGLAISRSIVEEHGGRLWAENNPDSGATFYFTIPIGKGDSA